MALLMAWLVALMAYSADVTFSGPGDFAKENIPVMAVKNGTSSPYSNWEGFCNSMPYKYLRPFQFTYVDDKGTSHASNPTFCPYPQANSIFRIFICCCSLITIFILFFKTPLSFFARQVWVVYALLFYASFVLDCDACATGYQSCLSNFGDTNLADSITAAKLKITCDSSKYPGLAIVDLIVVVHFFLIYTAWGMTPDLYVKKGQPPPQQYQPQQQQQFAPQPQFQPQPQYAPAPSQYAPAPAAAPTQGTWSPFAPKAAAAPAPAGGSLFGSKPTGGGPKTILGMQGMSNL